MPVNETVHFVRGGEIVATVEGTKWSESLGKSLQPILAADFAFTGKSSNIISDSDKLLQLIANGDKSIKRVYLQMGSSLVPVSRGFAKNKEVAKFISSQAQVYFNTRVKIHKLEQ